MKESLAECVRGIRSGIEVAEDAILKKDWGRASSATRQLLSFAGKLNQRIGVLTDFLEEAILEARAAAEVDRAMRPPLPLGDPPPAAPEPDDYREDPTPGPRKVPARRKGKPTA